MNNDFGRVSLNAKSPNAMFELLTSVVIFDRITEVDCIIPQNTSSLSRPTTAARYAVKYEGICLSCLSRTKHIPLQEGCHDLAPVVSSMVVSRLSSRSLSSLEVVGRKKTEYPAKVVGYHRKKGASCTQNKNNKVEHESSKQTSVGKWVYQ